MSTWFPIEDIVIPERRYRKVFNEASIRDLAESIASKGLLHPIVITEQEILVAGERRLRAVKYLYDHNRLFSCDGTPVAPGHIPATSLSDLDAIAIREAELAENLMREDLTWQEETRALAELAQLRRAQAAERNEKQPLATTARELATTTGRSVNKYERDLARAAVVAPYLDDPEVTAARSASDAFSIVSRRMERDFRDALTEATPRSPHLLYAGPFEDWIGVAPQDHFSCIIADPPYEIGAAEFGDAAKRSHRYDDDLTLAYKIIDHSYELTRPEAHLYLFCDVEHFLPLRDSVTASRWQPWRVPIIWHKGTTGHAVWGPKGLRRSYECILVARKGSKPFNYLGTDLIDIPNLKDREHAAQKPVALYEELLRRSCIAGDRVLDPCCGSGTIFEAATNLRLRATGIEPNANYANLARSRMEETNDD